MERVSVYIDGANFYHGVKSIDRGYKDYKFDFTKYIKRIVKGRRVVDKYYYTASLKQAKNPELFKEQQKLFARLKKDKFRVVLCKRQKRISKDGGDYSSIKGDDIHLAIDMLKDAYENKYDTAILISGDGDFAPLVRYVKNKGKKVENYHFEGSISLDLIRVCNSNFVIDRKSLNKHFYREISLMKIGDLIKKKDENK